jgi:hypothetical protein
MTDKPTAKPAGALIDALMRQSKQITADLFVLKTEIGAVIPAVHRREASIIEQRLYLISEQGYDFQEKLRALGGVVRGSNPDETV